MTKGWATAAIVLIAALAIGAGLALTGGPGQARKERRLQSQNSQPSKRSMVIRSRCEPLT